MPLALHLPAEGSASASEVFGLAVLHGNVRTRLTSKHPRQLPRPPMTSDWNELWPLKPKWAAMICITLVKLRCYAVRLGCRLVHAAGSCSVMLLGTRRARVPIQASTK